MTGRRQEAGDRVQPPVVLALAASRDAAQQPDGVGVPRLVEHLAGDALLDEFPGVQDPDPVAHLGDHGEVVADEEHRGVELIAQGRHQVEHLGLDGRVQRGRRLVQDEQRGLGGQRHGDDGPLRHPAGKLVRIPLHHPARVGDLHLAEHGLGALQGRLPVQAGDLVDLGDLAADLDRRVQRPPGLLVDHRDRAGPQLAQRVLPQCQRIDSVDADRARAHPAVTGQVPGEGQRHRGLAGSGLPDQPV